MKVTRTAAALAVALIPMILLAGCVLRDLPKYL